MTKKQFLETWKPIRTQALRKAYKGDPHGPACLAASLADLDKDGERIWKKYRGTFRDSTPDELRNALAPLLETCDAD